MQNLFNQFHIRPYVRFILAWLALSPAVANAYVGPGAGLTMLGSLWGLILAIVFVVLGLLILPFKIMRNRMKKNAADTAVDSEKPQEKTSDASTEQNSTADSD